MCPHRRPTACRARAIVIRACAPGTRVLIVGASRGAADDLAREVAASVPATFGLQRLSLTQLAAKTAILTLASDGCDVEHVARHRSGRGAGGLRCHARSVAGLFRRRCRVRQDSLVRWRERCRNCGWPASTGAAADTDFRSPVADLADLLDRVEASFAAASSADRAELFRAAARDARDGSGRRCGRAARSARSTMPPSASW